MDLVGNLENLILYRKFLNINTIKTPTSIAMNRFFVLSATPIVITPANVSFSPPIKSAGATMDIKIAPGIALRNASVFLEIFILFIIKNPLALVR